MVINSSHVCIDICAHAHLLVHSTTYEHWDCFQFLAVVNSAAPVPHVLQIHAWERDLLVIVHAYLQLYFVVVLQSLSHVWLFVTPWTAASQASLSFIISRSLLKLMSIELVILSNHLIFFPLLLLPSVFPSIRVFSSELALCIRWPKYWKFSFSISPSSGYSGLISFRIDWLDLLASQGTLKSLLQYHSSKASLLLCSAFFMFQLSHLYMTTRKTIILTMWTFVGKVLSLLFNFKR